MDHFKRYLKSKLNIVKEISLAHGKPIALFNMGSILLTIIICLSSYNGKRLGQLVLQVFYLYYFSLTLLRDTCERNVCKWCLEREREWE